MNVTGIPDLLKAATFNRGITQTRMELTKAANELVTGQKDNLSRELGGRAGEYNLVTKALADIDSSRSRMILANTRLSQTSITVAAMRATVDEFSAEAQSALLNNGAFGLTEIQQSARSQIENLTSLLNSSHAGRSLFAGDEVHGPAALDAQRLLDDVTTAVAGATDETAVDAAITAFFADGGDYDTTFYQGGAGQASSVQLDTGAVVQYNVKADDQAFKNVLEGLVRVTFATNTTSMDWANTVTSKMSDGLSGLIEVEANLGRQSNLVDDAIEISSQEKIILSESKNALDGVDAFEAASRVQALEAQLDAAYTVASRISRLSFTSYL